MRTITVPGVRRVRRNGRIELEEFTMEREVSDDRRHSVYCELCKCESYPECRKTCIIEKKREELAKRQGLAK